MTGGCDLRVAGASARFAAPEVRHGLIASGGTLARLARQIPYATAMQLLLTGQPLAAPRLLELGFLNEIVPDGSAVDRAVELARVVAANSPVAVTTTKKVVSEGTRVTLAEAYALEAKAERDTVRGPDAVEGAKAFLEKRRPSWVLD
jgi:enoyl-CoA hydratase